MRMNTLVTVMEAIRRPKRNQAIVKSTLSLIAVSMVFSKLRLASSNSVAMILSILHSRIPSKNSRSISMSKLSTQRIDEPDSQAPRGVGHQVSRISWQPMSATRKRCMRGETYRRAFFRSRTTRMQGEPV
jgi:hypothetical protein